MNYRNVLLLLITFIFAATTMLSAQQVSYEEMEQYAKQIFLKSVLEVILLW